MSIEAMKEHYENAGKNYEAANNARDPWSRDAYLEEADKECGKACEEAENTKQQIENEACEKAQEYYDKSADAYEKGDMKAAKEYQDHGDRVMSDAKEKQQEVDNEQRKAAAEAKSKIEEQQKTRYY